MAKSKWPQVRDNLKLIEKWAREGVHEKAMATNLGVSVTSWEEYKKNYPELSKVLKKSREGLVQDLVNALTKKGLGYDYEEKKVYTKVVDGETTTYTEITKKHQPADTGAAIFLIKNYDPEHFTDNPQMLDLKRQELELRKKISEDESW